MGSARERRARNTIYMIRGRARNDDDDLDVGIDVDDETRDEECSPLKKSLSVSRTFGQLGLNLNACTIILALTY